MAPKGKKRGKGKKKGKAKKEKKPKEMTEVTKAMYEITVKDLSEKLDHCRATSTELSDKNAELASKYTQQTLDLGDVIAYLKLQLSERAERLSELSERLSGVETQKELETSTLQTELAALQLDYSKREQELQNEVEMVNMRLNSLEEFRRMRDKFFDEKYALEQQLVAEREDAEKQLHLVDRQRALDMSALRKQAESKIADVARAYQTATRQRIHNTTVRAIRENVCVGEQIVRLTRRAASAERRYEGCRHQLRHARVHNSMEQQLHQQLLRQQLDYQQRLKLVQSECGQQLADSQHKVSQLTAECREREHSERKLNKQLQQLLTAKQQLSTAAGKHESAVRQLQKQLKHEQNSRQHLQQLLLKAGHVVAAAVTLPAAECNQQLRGGLLQQLSDVLTEADTVLARGGPNVVEKSSDDAVDHNEYNEVAVYHKFY